MTADIIELARQYGRYGYRRITALLRRAGWTVNKKRVERIWRCEGLKVPAKQPKRGRLWLNDGSCRLPVAVARLVSTGGRDLTRGVPEHIRSDSDAKMTAEIYANDSRSWGEKGVYIAPGTRLENANASL